MRMQWSVHEVVNLDLARLEKMTERCPKFFKKLTVVSDLYDRGEPLLVRDKENFLNNHRLMISISRLLYNSEHFERIRNRYF